MIKKFIYYPIVYLLSQIIQLLIGIVLGLGPWMEYIVINLMTNHNALIGKRYPTENDELRSKVNKKYYRKNRN